MMGFLIFEAIKDRGSSAVGWQGSDWTYVVSLFFIIGFCLASSFSKDRLSSRSFSGSNLCTVWVLKNSHVTFLSRLNFRLFFGFSFSIFSSTLGTFLVLNSVRVGLAVPFFITCWSQHSLNWTVVTANSPTRFFRVAFPAKSLDQVHNDNKAEHAKQH